MAELPEKKPGLDPVPFGVSLALACLGAAQALWAGFQWWELGELRRGAVTLCDQAGGNCADAWNAPVAAAIHELTGLPVAAWGVVWGVAATAAVLLRMTAASDARRALFSGAVRTLATVGPVAVLILAATLLQQGLFCLTCVVTYAIVLAYAAIAWAVPLGAVQLAGGGAAAAGICAVVFLLALLTGRDTPRGDVAVIPPVAVDEGPLSERLALFIDALPEEGQEVLAREIAVYREQEAVSPPPAPGLVGSENAAVRITDFHDPLCPHCARLHQVLERLYEDLPEGQLAVDPHHYPLDAACNPSLTSEAKNSVRCDASRALICMEKHPQGFRYSADVFGQQASLTREKLFELAAPYTDRDALEACIASDATEQRLQSDIAWAVEQGIRGTPFV
ncbi:MAG: thioredoxin domain-containing protein, partial [Myxococcales bacterium]|nr:thioredoxin domain-containing protein [Myxococcales bacterium]